MTDKNIFPKDTLTLEGKNEWVRKTEKAMTHLFTKGSDYDKKYGSEIILHNLYMAVKALPNDEAVGNFLAMINTIDEKVKE